MPGPVGRNRSKGHVGQREELANYQLGAILFALIALLGAGACATVKTPRADSYFEGGDYAQAARSYEHSFAAGSRVDRPDRALLRLALSHLLAEVRGSAGEGAQLENDVRRASDVLSRLLVRYPESPYAPTAAALLSALREATSLRAQLIQARQHLEATRADLRAYREQAEKLKGALEAEEGRLTESSSANEEHAAEIEKLQSRIARQQKKIDELKRSLSELKRIDMQRPR